MAMTDGFKADNKGRLILWKWRALEECDYKRGDSQ